MPTHSRTPDNELADAELPDAERDKADAGPLYNQGNPAGSAPDRAETGLTHAAAARQNDTRDHR